MEQVNLYCLDCKGDFTQTIDTNDVVLFETPYGEFECVQCLACGGRAKIVGRPTATTVVSPPWGRYEHDMHTGNAEQQIKAGDAFFEERQKWASSGKWRRWENSRKETWARNKPEWKKQQITAEKERKEKFVKSILNK